MKQIFSLGILLVSLIIKAQEINKYGHFINNTDSILSYTILHQEGDYLINQNDQLLKGNCLFQSNDKKITITSIEETTSSTLRVYDNHAELLYEEQFSQIINPDLSINKAFFSFYCKGMLYVVDLEAMIIEKFKSSIIYYIDSFGKPVIFNDRTITYNRKSYKINVLPTKILQFKGQTIFFTRNSLYSINNNEVNKTIDFRGAFFDVIIKNDFLYYVLKNRTEHGFKFTVFKTVDIKQFKEIEARDYSIPKSIENNKLKSPTSSSHEDIRGPLNYYDNNVSYDIGNSYGEFQQYRGNPYLHPGVDFLGNPNQEVYAVKTGVLKGILTTGGDLYWRIGIANEDITDESIGYLYAHLNQASIPYTYGDSIYQGELVGTLVPWPVTGFDHLHFARIKASGDVWDGSWWTLNNPLIDVINLNDTIKPVIENSTNELFAFRDFNGNYLSPDSLYGDFDIISKIYDNCNSAYNIDVYEINYNLSSIESPGNYIFNKLAFRFDMPLDLYTGNRDYSTLLINTIYSYDQTCYSQGNYNLREFYHIITNSSGEDTITNESQKLCFNSLDYQDGKYYLKVIAKDAKLNVTMDSMIVTIKNGISSSYNNQHKKQDIELYPNPVCNYIQLNTNKDILFEIYSVNGIIQLKGKCNRKIGVSSLDKGLYLVKTIDINNGYIVNYYKIRKQ
ncbi:MAG: hypothetical protein JEZ14_24270 [Marinilabiliaceae bacterium]|nr:hypothetical protein [Marinilabiliaceae bacterium]